MFELESDLLIVIGLDVVADEVEIVFRWNVDRDCFIKSLSNNDDDDDNSSLITMISLGDDEEEEEDMEKTTNIFTIWIWMCVRIDFLLLTERSWETRKKKINFLLAIGPIQRFYQQNQKTPGQIRRFGMPGEGVSVHSHLKDRCN